jgi:hypothetical protein
LPRTACPYLVHHGEEALLDLAERQALGLVRVEGELEPLEAHDASAVLHLGEVELVVEVQQVDVELVDGVDEGEEAAPADAADERIAHELVALAVRAQLELVPVVGEEGGLEGGERGGEGGVQ